MSKYLFVKYLLISKQTGTQIELFKKLIFGGSIWGGPRGVAPPNYVKIIVFKISADIIKHWHSKLSYSKNWFVGDPFGGVPGGGGTPKLFQNICLLNIY